MRLASFPMLPWSFEPPRPLFGSRRSQLPAWRALERGCFPPPSLSLPYASTPTAEDRGERYGLARSKCTNSASTSTGCSGSFVAETGRRRAENGWPRRVFARARKGLRRKTQYRLGQEAIWLSESLRILREEAPDVEITLMTKSSPELAVGQMQGKIDVALLRREAHTVGLAFRFLSKEPLIAILPARHHLARHRTVPPQDLARESFISTARAAPVLRSVIDDYEAKTGITLKQKYDAETLSGGMSLVASIRGFTLLPLYARNALIPSVVARPLRGEVPTIGLMMGYNKSNTSPLLKKFLLRADELVNQVNRVFQGEAYSGTLKRGDRKPPV